SLSPGDKLPERPDYSDHQFERRFDAFLVTDDEIFINGSMQLDPNVIRDVQLGQSRLTVFGYVDYIDQVGVRHRSGYAREYERADQNNLVYLTQPGYNYEEIVS